MKYIPRTLHIVRSGVVHLILGGACCFTAFPFLWMAVSSLKTKEEVMAVDTFLPSDSQYQNYSEILFHSPIPRYLANSLLVAVSVVIIQVICCALFTYAVTFMKAKGKNKPPIAV